jgi:2'-5' RNA ligase
VRLFLAINLPPEVRCALFDATASLRELAPGLAWVSEPMLHLTLKFLGDRSPETAVMVQDAMCDVARRHEEVEMTVGGIGAFPTFRRPRVIWIGARHDPRLELVHHDVELRCADLGFELDGRAFRPHVTLARVRERIPDDLLGSLTRATKRVAFEADVPVRSIDLMQSQASPAARGYAVLGSAPLRSR